MTRLLVSLCLSACAAGAPPPHFANGDAAGPPRMEALPRLPAGGRPPGLTPTMTFAWTLAEQALDLPDPPPAPAQPTVANLGSWTDSCLRPWLRDKNRLVTAARRELDSAAEERLEQRILAGALDGLLHEDVARVLLSIPVPLEIAEEER
ncbi:MAG: hypothetical protein AAF447_26390, partial [Myxococcota bacterium]